MTIERKVLLMVRHGEHEDNVLTPESVQRIYDNTGSSLRDFVREHSIEPRDTLMRHSNAPRTEYTGRAVIAGALDLQPTPRSHQDLDALSFDGIDIKEIKKLGYGHMKFNWDALVEDGDPNSETYLSRWLADPRATIYEGVEITPYNEIIQEGRDTLLDTLDTLFNNERNFGIIATHGAIAEALVIAAINPTRSTPVKNFDEIGGLFHMENFATLTVDYTSKGSPSGRRYVGTLRRNGQEYLVNLSRKENGK